MLIRVAHSPDSDDAFMFYPLTAGVIDTEGMQIEHVLADIQTLNESALRGTYEVSAVSFHAYPYISDKYLVLPSGGSVGDGYGPMVVAKEKVHNLKGERIAIPGLLTTAYLVLRLYEPDFEPIVYPFDKIVEVVASGELKAGLVIHEGQLSYQDRGLSKLVDLGHWWKEETSLPLPLGCNVVRRDLGPDVIRKVERLMKKSVEYAIDHKEEALSFAKNYARDIKEDLPKVDRFISMYVNKRTLDYGEDGRKAARLLLKLGYERGFIKVPPPQLMFSDEINYT